MKSVHLLLILAIAAPFSIYGVYRIISEKHVSLPVYANLQQRSVKSQQYWNEASVLVDHDGLRNAINDNGKIKVVNFFFANCPVICPAMTRNLQNLQASFDAEEIELISFTIDPARDSISALQAFAKRSNLNTTNWRLITGNKKTIYGLARNNFTILAGDGDGGENDFIHSEQVVLIDAKNNIRGYYSGIKSSEISQLAKDIKKLQNEKQESTSAWLSF